jgi:putative endonuclease
MRILARNVVIPGGEIDVVARDGKTLVAVEVRTSTGRIDPIDAIDDPKRARVSRLGGMVRAGRVDLIGIGLRDHGIDIHWLPGQP